MIHVKWFAEFSTEYPVEQWNSREYHHHSAMNNGAEENKTPSAAVEYPSSSTSWSPLAAWILLLCTYTDKLLYNVLCRHLLFHLGNSTPSASWRSFLPKINPSGLVWSGRYYSHQIMDGETWQAAGKCIQNNRGGSSTVLSLENIPRKSRRPKRGWSLERYSMNIIWIDCWESSISLFPW